MNSRDLKFREWSDAVAAIAVDALVDANLVQKAKFGEACSIVGEEVFIRLVIGDLPSVNTPFGAASIVEPNDDLQVPD